ncbi:hypothetical protein ACFQ1Q_01550 [Winogradskyella litorisediminis]|uniref:Uncharacterized protein n=1 Tax=Winogradskyella litorisediminis TaxID=1156618 RepID=A0ABW3N2H4_9FLAO
MKQNFIQHQNQNAKTQKEKTFSKSYKDASKKDIRSGLQAAGLVLTLMLALGFTFYGNSIFSEKIALCLYIVVGILFIKLCESSK